MKTDSEYLAPHYYVRLLEASQTARELGKVERALALDLEALSYFVEQEDWLRVTQGLRSIAMCFSHLQRSTTNSIFARLSQAHLREALQVAEENEIRREIAPIHRSLGQAATELSDHDEAVSQYSAALEYMDDMEKVSETERGEYTSHLGHALWLAGKKEEGLAKIREGLERIQQHRSQDVDHGLINNFLADVWESGCQMRLAEVLNETNKEDSKQHLIAAEEIINRNPDLHKRREQLEHLKNRL